MASGKNAGGIFPRGPFPGLAMGAFALFAESPVHAAEHGGGPGFPQLDVTTYPSQLLWLFVSFGLLYVLMSRLALPGVSRVLEKRRITRQDDLDAAADMTTEAERVRHGYEYTLSHAQEAAQETLSASSQAISGKIAEKESAFAEEARRRVALAEDRIAKAKREAQASISDISAEIAAEMVTAIAGVDVGKAAAQQAVTAAMKEAA